ARVTIDGREMMMFASYNYLGLITHPKIKKAAIEAIEKYGTGAAGVRLLAGTTKIHEKLEAKIAKFTGGEDAVTYSSGYVTNLAAITTLCQRGDLVVIDKLDHASIIDGCLLSGATHRSYLHNDMESLERILSNSGRYINKLIIVDAVYSMDGDVSNLPEISRLAKKYNAKVMVDEAHSIGVLGKTGHGIEEHFELKGAVDIHMGTLSKTIPSIGGYLAGDKDLISYLKHNSRPFIFSASLPPVAAATAIACLEVIEIFARLLLPILVYVPIKYLYPTGEKQEKSNLKYVKYFQDADIIAGDYLGISQYMPEDMGGKTIITNTITSSNVEDLKKRGVNYLITTTPEF
ncbi:unnamed protein product, partial [marine sediment metagenome]